MSIVTASLTTQSALAVERLRSTPALLRTWSVGLAVLVIVAAALASVATAQFISTTNKVQESTGPVLISTQGLLASIAEADAANTAVFLSGESGDREQLRLYEAALSRAPQQVEDIAAGIGDNAESHASLKQIGSLLTEYARLTERARVNNLAGDPTATEDLNAAIELVSGQGGMLEQAELVTTRTQASLDDDIDAGFWTWVGGLTAAGAAVVALVLGQRDLRRRTNRLLNPPLLLATAFIAGLGLWLVFAQGGRIVDLETARDDAYDSIALTAELQTAAFEYKSNEAQAIIADDSTLLPTPDDALSISQLLESLSAEADTTAELAAVTNLQTRWSRYLATSAEIESSLIRVGDDAARTIAITDGNRDFNGFNTTVESVLLANRDQFERATASAENRMNWLRWGSIVLPLMAAVAILAGYQIRINEYW